jgi:hypothetical protein
MEKSQAKPIEKTTFDLETIKNKMFKDGEKCDNIWEKTGNFVALRMAVSTYRAAMQANRDQSRYKNKS